LSFEGCRLQAIVAGHHSSQTLLLPKERVMLERQVIRYLETVRARHALPLKVVLWDGSSMALSEEATVTVRLRDAAAARHLLKPTMASLGEAFVEGGLEIDGPIDAVIGVAEGLARQQDELPASAGRLPNWLARHTRRSDRKAIEYHYDVSDAFYSHWLDPAMVYSCAYFRSEDASLAQAQADKLDHVCRKLMLQPGEHLLDIGCGWGAMVLHAARHYGVRATGITLSRNQCASAAERIRAAGLSDRVEVRLQDYRDLPSEPLFEQDLLDRDVRTRGPGKPARVLRDRPAAAQTRRHRAEPWHHRQRRGQPQRGHGRRRIHRPLRLPRRRTAPCVAGGARALGRGPAN
jgi:hypothetical protein